VRTQECWVDRVLRVDPASSIERMQMTAFGATSLFTVAPAKVGNPPERTPGTGIKRQILSTSKEAQRGWRSFPVERSRTNSRPHDLTKTRVGSAHPGYRQPGYRLLIDRSSISARQTIIGLIGHTRPE
jgi:hypothetical protein